MILLFELARPNFRREADHMAWITANLGTIIVLAVVLLVVGLIIRRMIKDKAAGKSTCGNNCAHCAAAGTCHAHQIPKPSGK